MPTVAVVLVAAGAGTRLGGSVPKAFASLRGRTLLEHAVDGIRDAGPDIRLVVVAPADRLDEARRLVPDARIVAGGATRQASVAAGLGEVEEDVEIVLVHDAARPLTPASQIRAVVDAVAATAAGIVPGLRVADSVKRTQGDRVLETVDRDDLVAVQTPQGFPRAALVAAYAGAVTDYTDDAALFAAAGGAVRVIPGDARAVKITTGDDLRRAERDLAPDLPVLRTGVGVDVHGYDDASPLWLGGLYWPNEPGLSGHSDGDAVIHAICDALLSAAGLGDLGSRFGTADPQYAGAASEVFLAETLRLLAAEGLGVVNVAVQVVGARPTIAPRRPEVEARLTSLVGAPVSVGATTTDGLGFTGRGEGLAATATALLTAS